MHSDAFEPQVFARSQMLIDEPVQPLTVADRDLKRALISGDDHDFPQGVIQDAASIAHLEVISDDRSKGVVNVIVDKIRQAR